MTNDKKKLQLKYPADWIAQKNKGQKLTIITAYDACFARLAEQSDVDAILVGDSLAMVVQGQNSTLPVSLQEMIYHCRMVRRGAPESFVIADMPFASYQCGKNKGIKNGMRLLKEAQADAVKLEGAHLSTLKIIQRLVEAGTPVVGHIGLTPQSYKNTAGFRVQGKSDADQKRIKQEAKLLEEAGCFAVVLELMSRSLAKEITQSSSMVTIGIGAGMDVDAQVLVLHDVLGLYTQFQPRHVKRYANLAELSIQALNDYDLEVKTNKFPSSENSFT